MRRLTNIIAVLAILIGCSVLLYPTVSNYLAERNASYAISGYDESLAELNEEERLAMLEEARAYNETLTGADAPEDPFAADAADEDAVYDELLDPDGTGVMGSIRIPVIGVELPVYHGTKESVLQKGTGHLKGSSLPVGGPGTHTVITGHRGLPTLELFSDLDRLAEGDVFYLDVRGETLAYEVDRILTVLPDEMDALEIVEGQDYATLVTCTPYAVNTHRLLVRGHRIPYEEARETAPDEMDHKVWMPAEVKAAVCALALAALGAAGYALWRRTGRNGKTDQRKHRRRKYTRRRRRK